MSDYQSKYALRLISTRPDVAEVLVTWVDVDINEPFQVHQKVSGFRNTSLDMLLVCRQGLGIWAAMASNQPSSVIAVYSPETLSMRSRSDQALQTSSTIIYHDNKLGIDVNRPKVTSQLYTSATLETIRNITQSLQWKSVAIIYDVEAESMVDELIMSLNRQGIFVMSYPEHEIHMVQSNNRTLLDDIYESFDEKGVNITVICQVRCVQRVLNRANLFDHMRIHKHQTAMRQRSRWFIITSSSDLDQDVGAYSYDLDNVAVFNLHRCAVKLNNQDTKMPSLLDKDGLHLIPSAKIVVSTNGANVTLPEQSFDKVLEEFVEEVNSVPLCTQCSLYTLMWLPIGW
ncbi:uncharacterized protein LOC110464580 [Mizuhopecten yessoensis]|uniref:uncharacterized protein LOC110464580 n=1 Tax=Mizuhopecten yessoensis TaxID=6573 RepID=UPI000B459F84|nr:uncharacterized protein LOC110464580 [Mizuhopecten yessoensis]